MFLIKKEGSEILSIPVKELQPKDTRHISSPLAISILELLSHKPMYSLEIANKLGVHEQKVYYHMRNFKRAGLVEVFREESRQGAVARYYKLSKPAFAFRFQDFENTHKVDYRSDSPYLRPFISDGQLDALVIVGSPDPHGPEKARSRDGYYAIDLGLFFGTFLNSVTRFHVKLDTEVHNDELNQNLILIGGPIVNKITERANRHLPIRFEKEHHWSIYSTFSKNRYPADEAGLIVSIRNPFNASKHLLVVAGKRYSGTRAAIIAFLKHFREIESGNIHDRNVHAKVVEGTDMDSDGIIDDVEFRE